MSEMGADSFDATTVDTALTAHFSLLRRPQTEQDLTDIRLPPRVVDRYGLLPAQMRMVELPGVAKVWVIPGSRGAALTRENVPAHGRGSSCGSVEDICARGLWGLTEDLEGRRWMTGLVPDGNREVTLDLCDGGREVVPTAEGVVVIKELERVKAIGFLDVAGSRRRQLC